MMNDWMSLLFPATPVPPRSSKPSATEAAASDASKTASVTDSPKLDSRKRTRQSLQSPMPEAAAATATSTPSSGKRSRRIWTDDCFYLGCNVLHRVDLPVPLSCAIIYKIFSLKRNQSCDILMLHVMQLLTASTVSVCSRVGLWCFL